ncbi:MAG: hypothetical protein JWN67_4569 [Actinomycetia bacterium]|nr:hypothetical protein [Actinomycetes bacterium]
MTTLSPRRVFEPVVEAATLRHLGLVLVAGVGFEIGVWTGVASLGGTIGAVFVAGTLVASGRVRSAVGRLLAGSAALFGAFLCLRTSPWLVSLDLLVIAGGLVGAALLGRDTRLDDVGPGALAGRAWGAIRPMATGVAYVTRPVRRTEGLTAERRAGLAAVGRGAVLAVPVVVVLGLLLASADALFARVVRVDALVGAIPDDVWAQALLVVLGAIGTAGLLHVASTSPGAPVPGPDHRLGTTEWTVVLGGVVGLFLVFAGAQLVALSDGGHRVLATEGLTYAEYARTGYFQLLAVAGLTAALLLGLGTLADRTTAGRRFVVLAEAAVALTLVILLVAVRRLGLYEDAYGWTMLRLMVKASAVWLAAAFALLGLRLAGVRPDRAWLLPAVTVTGLLVLLGLNVMDPEATVARHNLDRGATGHELDSWYLGGLSDDAVPVVAGSPAGRDLVCTGEEAGSGLSWNRAAARAAEARARVC